MNLLLLRMGKCRHNLISRDLIWIEIVIWNYLQTKSVIISAIRFAVFINCISIEMIAKSWFETSPKQPRTMWRHNAAATS